MQSKAIDGGLGVVVGVALEDAVEDERVSPEEDVQQGRHLGEVAASKMVRAKRPGLWMPGRFLYDFPIDVFERDIALREGLELLQADSAFRDHWFVEFRLEGKEEARVSRERLKELT